VQVDGIKTRVESAPGVCNQRLKLKCDEPLSKVGCNFNLRRYTEANKTFLFGNLPTNPGGVGLGRRYSSTFRLYQTRFVSLTHCRHSSAFRLNVTPFCGIRWVATVSHRQKVGSG